MPPPQPPSPRPTPSLLRAVYGGLPRRIYWLALGQLVNRAGFFAVPMLLLFLTRERGIEAGRAGALLALYAAGAIGSAVAGGWMSDGLGRRPTMLVSLFGAAALWLAVLWARSPATLGAALVAAGFCADLHRAASASLIADLCEVGQRPRAYALLRMAGNAGLAVGPTLAGLLAERSFVWVFVGESLTCAAFGAVVLLALPETREPAGDAELEPLGLGDVCRDKTFVLLCLANLAVAAVYVQQIATLPLYVVGELGLRPSHHGLLLSLNGLGIVLLELWIVQRTRRTRPLRAVAAGSLVLGLGFGGLALAAGLPAAALCVAVWTVGEMVAWPVLPDWIVRRAPPRLRGRYLGVSGLFAGLGLLLGAAAGPWIARSQGYDPLWGLCLLACAAAGGIAWALDAREARAARRTAPSAGG